MPSEPADEERRRDVETAGRDDDSPDQDADPATALLGFLDDVLDIDVAELDATTTITGPEPTPAAQLRSFVADADSAVGVVPVLPTSLLDSLDGVDGLRASVVLTGGARERLDGPALSLAQSRLADTDITLYGHDGDCPVGLFLLDDTAVCSAFDGAGDPAALVVSRAPALRSWVAETCGRYREDADVLVGGGGS